MHKRSTYQLSFFLLFILWAFQITPGRSQTTLPLRTTEGMASVGALAMDATGRLYAGTYAGLFSSADGGASWASLTDGIQNPCVLSIALTPSGELFIGTLKKGIFRSSDRGYTWQPAEMGQPVISVRDIEVDALGYLYAGTDDGLFRSTDGGQCWDPMRAGFQTSFIQDVALDEEGSLYAATLKGIYVSEDQGVSWVRTGLNRTYVKALAVSASGEVFAGTCGGGVYRSSDCGHNWTPVNEGLGFKTVEALVIDSKGHLFAGTFGGGVFVSENAGASWRPINQGLEHATIWTLSVQQECQLLAGTFRGGIYRSLDHGDTWMPLAAPQVGSGLDRLVQ